MTNLFIPKKLKVGFNKRSETFTGKLAYVIYYDEKGVLRKEKSFESWIDKKIPTIEIENTPRTGYLFNKGVQRGGYHWGSGRSSIRVYDPRDFEFEINVDNLMGILMHSDVSKRDIVEECVFAWEGKELVLLPVSSEEYQKSIEFTNKLSEKISARDLVKGYTYNQKRDDEALIYIGHFDWYDYSHSKDDYYTMFHKTNGKKHVFYSENRKSFITPGIATFSSVNSELVVSNYADLVDSFFKTINSQPIKSVTIKKVAKSKRKNGLSLYKINGQKLSLFQLNNYYSTEKQFHENSSAYLTEFNLVLKNDEMTKAQIRKDRDRGYYSYNKVPADKWKMELDAKTVELGLDPKNLTLDEKVQVLESLGFGELVVTYKNDFVSNLDSI